MFAEYQLLDDVSETARIFPWGRGARAFTIRFYNALNQHIRPVPKNRTLLLEGESCQTVYCVLDGWLALSKTLQEGQKQIIDFALPGDIVDPVGADGDDLLGERRGPDRRGDGRNAISQLGAHGRQLPELQKLAHLAEAAQQARRAERMLRLGKGTADMRIAYAIIEFCIRINALGRVRTSTFHIPLTQQQLGDYLGLSSVHVCRTMRRMTCNKILEMRNHMDIQVLDAPALTRLAGVECDTLKREIMPFTPDPHLNDLPHRQGSS